MRKKPNNKLIGLFIVSGIALFVAIIGMFVSEKMMGKDKDLVVMYFSESIMGLDVGSQVVFKGVSVGKVAKIDVITDLQELEFSIPVYVSFNERAVSSEQPTESDEEILHELIAKGLRARLATQNMLTGQLMIELEFIPDAGEAVCLKFRRFYHNMQSSLKAYKKFRFEKHLRKLISFWIILTMKLFRNWKNLLLIFRLFLTERAIFRPLWTALIKPCKTFRRRPKHWAILPIIWNVTPKHY